VIRHKRTLLVLLSACSLSAQVNNLTARRLTDGTTAANPSGCRTDVSWPKRETLSTFGDAGIYSDYVLKIYFRNSPRGNSGVFPCSALDEVTGYELQIRNESSTFPTGSLVNHVKKKPVSPTPEEWHSYNVTVQGDHFVVALDGDTVLDNSTGIGKSNFGTSG
jgi:hypothetical protein